MRPIFLLTLLCAMIIATRPESILGEKGLSMRGNYLANQHIRTAGPLALDALQNVFLLPHSFGALMLKCGSVSLAQPCQRKLFSCRIDPLGRLFHLEQLSFCQRTVTCPERATHLLAVDYESSIVFPVWTITIETFSSSNFLKSGTFYGLL